MDSSGNPFKTCATCSQLNPIEDDRCVCGAKLPETDDAKLIAVMREAFADIMDEVMEKRFAEIHTRLKAKRGRG